MTFVRCPEWTQMRMFSVTFCEWLNELGIIVFFPGTTSTLVCIFFLFSLCSIFQLLLVNPFRYLLRIKFYYNFVYDFVFLPNYTLMFDANLQRCFLEKLYFELVSCKFCAFALSFTNLPFDKKMIIFLCCCSVLQNDVFFPFLYRDVCLFVFP